MYYIKTYCNDAKRGSLQYYFRIVNSTDLEHHSARLQKYPRRSPVSINGLPLTNLTSNWLVTRPLSSSGRCLGPIQTVAPFQSQFVTSFFGCSTTKQVRLLYHSIDGHGGQMWMAVDPLVLDGWQLTGVTAQMFQATQWR